MEAHPQAAHIQNLCVCRAENVGGACQCVVPVMAERAGMFEWSSGVFLPDDEWRAGAHNWDWESKK